MLRLRRLNADGTARGRPLIKLRLALIALAIGSMALDGCSFLESNGIGGGCKSCGGLGGLRRTRILFRRRDPGCCGGAEGGTVIEGVPPAVVVPGAAPLTPVIPGAPAEAGSVPDLSPADDLAPTTRNSGTSPAGAGTSSTPATSPNKTGYTTTYQPRSRPSGGGSLARTIPDLQPTPGSAAGRGSSHGVTLSESLIDNLPPPDTDISPPAPIESTPATARVVESAPEPATVEPVTTLRTPSPEAIPDPAPEPELPADVPESVAIGIAHFKVVDARLAGGSFPSTSGLAWLADKSYRTVLDLREVEQIRSEDFAAIAHQGLRHVYLPVTAGKLDAEVIRRFEQELAQTDARPLYFCDGDGTRAATLWYIHRVAVDKVDRPSARRDAESLGSLEPSLLQAANAYLDTLNSAPRAAEAPAAVKPAEAPITPARPQAEANPPEPAGTVVNASDPTGWHPYAALAMTALGLPFACWGCGSLSGRSIRRASLPAPVRRSKALPASSDA